MSQHRVTHRLAARSRTPADAESDQRSRNDADHRRGAHSAKGMAPDVPRRFTHGILGGVTRCIHGLARLTHVLLDRLDPWPATRFDRACRFSNSWHDSPPGTAASN
jgi:hypothetical protein